MAASSLARRVATAVVLVPLVLAALFLLPPIGWSVVVGVVVVLAALEWARLCRGTPAATTAFVATLAIALGVVLVAAAPQPGRGLPDVVVFVSCGASAVFWCFVAPGWLARQWPASGRVATWIVGLVVLFAAWVALVELQARSPWLTLAAMAVVWIADTAAYFAGRRFGRHKLAPAISPGKTWEGVWGALAAVVVYALLLATTSFPVHLEATGTAVFVVGMMLLAAVSVVGDLFESLLKRQAGVKDSGHLLPGHGGILDRVDALLAAMPLAALAVTAWLATPGAP